MKRICDNCREEYEADKRNIKRGWGLTCSKSCAASKREKSKKGYNPDRVKRNNALRVVITDMKSDYKKRSQEKNNIKYKSIHPHDINLEMGYEGGIDSFNDPV